MVRTRSTTRRRGYRPPASPSAARAASGERSRPKPAGAATRAGSFDDLVDADEDRRWDRQSERLGGLEVDDQFVMGGLLEGQLGRTGAAQDLVDQGRTALEIVAEHRAIRQQPTCLGVVPHWIHRRQAKTRSEPGNPPTLFKSQR